MKLLITGSKGQLGTELQRIIREKKAEIGSLDIDYKISEVVALDVDELDISDIYQVWDTVVNLHAPDIIINCAAYTNVDACEENPDLAFKVNALGAANLSKAAYEIGAEFIHISTDYVFSGDKTDQTPYKEWDIANPTGVYGKSKRLGEDWAQCYHEKTYVVRTSWLYGYEGGNFVKTILKAGKVNKSLKVVNDQVGNPTSANDLAYHLLQLPFSGNYGVYHCTNEETCSWYDFAKKFIELSGIDSIVEPCATEEFPRPAKRPAYSALDNMYLRNTVGNKMRSWQDAIKEYMTHYNKETGEIER